MFSLESCGKGLLDIIIPLIGGGIAGRALNRRMDNRAVERLFIALMAVIIGISVFNAVRYAGVL